MSKNLERYNQFIIQLIGGATSFAKEIELDTELTDGQKYNLNQQVLAGIYPFQKQFESLEKSYKELAKNQLKDLGDKQSEVMRVDDMEIYIKYTYPKPKLNAEKLEADYINALAEINAEYKREDYLVESTPSQKVIIQTII